MKNAHNVVGRVVALAAILLAGNAAWGDGLQGRLAFADIAAFSRADSLDAAYGGRNRNDFLGNLRIGWTADRSGWSVAFDYLIEADYGDDARLARAESMLMPAPPSTWLSLTDRFADRGQLTARHGIDRLSVGYATENVILRFGRQALSWGSGLVFRPMDLVDPFAPDATDTEYKPGTDMAYAQILFDDGSDLQIVAAPRPARSGALPAMNDSTLALQYHATVMGHQATLVAARDRGDWVLGLGLNGNADGATWNAELIPTFLAGGGVRVSALANISDAFTLLDRNATIFAEYYRNGFGAGGRGYSLAALPSDLTDRLARGQAFVTRRDYFAAGLTFEATPLVTLAPTVIVGLDDSSVYPLFQATLSLADDLTLVAGAHLPLGSRGSEFGGMRTMPASTTFYALPAQVYLQVRRYF